MPNPRYIVFYNGTDANVANGVKNLRRSNSFEIENSIGAYEGTATLTNTHIGEDEELFQKCINCVVNIS